MSWFMKELKVNVLLMLCFGYLVSAWDWKSLDKFQRSLYASLYKMYMNMVYRCVHVAGVIFENWRVNIFGEDGMNMLRK